MLKRYPHKGVITLKPKSSGSDTGILGSDTATDVSYPIQCRFEDTNGHGEGYQAKVYARQFPEYQLIGTDNAKFLIAGRVFNVKRIFPFQTHIEIWLV